MYPSDLSDAQWARLEPLLWQHRGSRHARGRPRKYELRRVVDALLSCIPPFSPAEVRVLR